MSCILCCYLVYCSDKGYTESVVTWTPWQRGYTVHVLKRRCKKRNAHAENRPLLRRRGGSISKHVHVYDRIKILDMDLEETKARNDCAGKGQQQFNRPTNSYIHTGRQTAYQKPIFRNHGRLRTCKSIEVSISISSLLHYFSLYTTHMRKQRLKTPI
jgi:hypothetical protein